MDNMMAPMKDSATLTGMIIFLAFNNSDDGKNVYTFMKRPDKNVHCGGLA